MTLIDSLDKTARPPELREELWAQYPQAKQAQIRVGGDFPFLSSAEEVNLFIEVKLPWLYRCNITPCTVTTCSSGAHICIIFW
jgi:hypothetical protein